jgi:hypothetical protein
LAICACKICHFIPPTPDSLPEDVAALKAMAVATQVACLEAEAQARDAEADVRARELEIEQMKFTIAKLRHERFGQSSERSAVLEQLELQLADMQEDVSQDEAAALFAAAAAAASNIAVTGFERHKPMAGLCRSSAAQADRLSLAVGLSVLRRHAEQARRGRDRNAGADPAPVEGTRACAREVLPAAPARRSASRLYAGGQHAAAIYTLIQTAKLNDVDPQARLADILTRLQDHPARLRRNARD